MQDRLRLLPRGFLKAWITAFGDLPPDDFLSTYETLCDALYFGIKKDTSEDGHKRGGHLRSDYFFADASLLRIKGLVDVRLACVASGLRRWCQRRSTPRPRQLDRLPARATASTQGAPRDRSAE